MLAQQSAPPGHAFLSPSPAPTTSNALALRDPSDQWSALGGDGALIPLSNEALSEEEHLRILLERARKIEEEATKENPGPNQKRSIPPFVLKLSSFLNNGRNSDLIRWSEKGDSFIVLDEEEFAKKLIPEMFKHNNYASFVRQLNMYGFHKRVGLSDNSMRASEKKNKSPSEYAHPYFLRAHPVLQWLITKPNKTGGKKRQKQANKDSSGAIDQDSDAEDFMDDPTGQYALSDIHPGRNIGRGEAGPLAKTELGKLRDQLAQVQQKQQQCLTLIQQLQNNQHEIVQRAQKFEEMHHRHENSITAILNFLANVFRKSLEENGDTTSPNHIRNELQSNPEETMLKIMGETNARMTPGVDLPEAAATTSARMSSGQRNKMPAASLSPILNVAKPPSVQEVSRQQNGISQVEALQRNIGQDINSLAQLAAPLSPNGQIMGIDGFQNGGSDYFGDSNNTFDFNQYLDPTAMDTGYNFDFNDLNNAGNYGATDGTDFDFSLPNAEYSQSTAAPLNGGLTAGTDAVTDTPSPAVTEEIQRPDLDGSEQPATKRRRQG
ncbi:putative heat shock factor protein hsf24 [Diaporthe ampelina]|uniref:Putative heat shock factor protein hsf24 n=1 Tax=Diaporthe ampelina TaxID=1214573 RepID=A0A0G2I9S8_9PEZI|nr:putative heat shock factor protein hsf24 [Diaporthe ampelina]